MSDEQLLASLDELHRRMNAEPHRSLDIQKEWYQEQLESKDPTAIHLAMVHSAIIFSINDVGESSNEQLVLLIHGIRTQAEWQGMVRKTLKRDTTTVECIKYEYFDVFRFWCPVFTRETPLNDILWKIKDAIKQHADKELVIIAHSFGTYAVAKLLERNPDISCTRMILCGSIIDRKFRWDKLPNRPEVVNDCGSKDIWPVLGQSLSWGYGASGTFGFGTPGVKDRNHDCKHSDYFNQNFVETYWKPWTHDGLYVSSEYDETQPTGRWWLSALTLLPLKWVVVAGLVYSINYFLFR